MAIIPNDEKVIMVSGNVNTTYSGSKALKETAEWYTMQDVSNTVKPYKVYTALLTQTGTDAPVATVLENTGNFGNWTYGGGGTYYLNYDPTLTPVIAPFGNFAGIANPYIPIYAGFSGPNGVINGWYSIYPESAGVLRLDFWNSPLIVGTEMSNIMGTTALYVDIKFY